MPPGEGEFMGCGFVAKLPTFSQALLDWTNILAFFFFFLHMCFFNGH